MKTLAILGNNYQETTAFIDKILKNTKARTDREHIKMNIIIDNKFLEKNVEEIIKIIEDLENINSDNLVLTFNDTKISKIIANNIHIPLLNTSFSFDDSNLMEKILACKVNL